MRYQNGPEVLDNVSFSLEPASFYFLTGPSGAGKTTILRLLMLALRPTKGSITIFERDTATIPRGDLHALRRRIGVVFQDFRLLDHLTALENVALPLRVAGMNDALAHRHVSELLGWVGLSEQLHAFPGTLSGGQKQRVAIARAVIGRPKLLLADEPTGNVDHAIAMRLLYLLEELNRMGATVVIATHNDNLVQQFSYPVLRIEDGRVVV